MHPSEISERRHRLTNISTAQRGELAHDWIMLKHSMSPRRNIKRYGKPLAIGAAAVVGAILLYSLRGRLNLLSRLNLSRLNPLSWLPALWLARRSPVASFAERLFAHFRRRAGGDPVR